MSLGTVMTDSLCLPKVRLEKTTLAALLCSKKKTTKKQTEHVPSFEVHNESSAVRQITCLPDMSIPSGDHQAIAFLLSESIYTPLMKEGAGAIYLSRVTQAVGI